MKPKTDINSKRFNWMAVKDKIYCLAASVELALEQKFDKPTFLELGTFNGNTIRNLARIIEDAGKAAHICSVDLNPDRAKKPQSAGPTLLFDSEIEWNKAFKDISENITCEFITGKTSDVVDSCPKDVSWLLVDACHCYDCTLNDLNLYAPNVMSKGIIAIDDTANNKRTKENSQWVIHNEPQKFGIIQAIKDCNYLQKNFMLVHESHIGHGIQIWQKK